MHYITNLLPALALVASIDARAVSHGLNRRYQNAAPVAAQVKSASFSPCSGGGDAAAVDPAAAAVEMAESAKAAVESASASPSTENATSGPGAAGANARAIYFMSNQDENSVFMLPVQEDGTLAAGSIIGTGGKGASLIDAMTGEPVATDTLASQGAVRVVGNSLFAVNAGSNTLSMFAIDPQDPAKLTAVGQPVETGGDFPTSIATSESLQTVCVAHTGAAAGITCAKFDATTGLSAFDPLRPFSLGQTNPPTGPLNGIGTTLFNADASRLITTVKGNPLDPAASQPGFISIFAVDAASGLVGTTDTRSTPAATAVLFGTVSVPGLADTYLATDASFGSLTLDLSRAAAPQTLARSDLAGQTATCWATVSPLTNTGFVTDVAVNRLVEVDLRTGQAVTELQGANPNTGMLDLQAVGTMVYALAPGNGSSAASVAVFDVAGGRGRVREVQNFVVEGLDSRGMGMAFHI